MDLMHTNSVRAGYIDLDGCTVVDMLARYTFNFFSTCLFLKFGSYFVPTCSECSTPVPAPGIISVRAESTMAICRECHKRLSKVLHS
jgi:hypothetical protein